MRICPRCDRQEVSVLFEPSDKSWTIFRCSKCDFVWRNTEDASVTDPEKFDRRFKINPVELHL